MLLGLIFPTQGDAYIYGQHVWRQHGVLRRVGAIVEGASFYNFLSGRKNLEVLARTANQYDPARIDSLLVQVGLADRAEQRTHGYSTGMKQRLGLAAALLTDPDLLILDEPTNGLDPGGMREIRQFIRELVDQHGKTVFLSSHLLAEVEQVCDRVAIINQGEIVREGAVSDLLEGKTRLRVEATPSDKAADVLRERWAISTNGQYLTVNAGRADAPEVVRRLTQANIDVYHVAAERQTLEEYFLSVLWEQTRHA
jgi:ABC-2 type transport system ATP-binding protein